jgi:hypothetical protein
VQSLCNQTSGCLQVPVQLQVVRMEDAGARCLQTGLQVRVRVHITHPGHPAEVPDLLQGVGSSIVRVCAQE